MNLLINQLKLFKKNLFALLVLCISALQLQAQDRNSISGIITDTSNLPLSGVTVSLEGSSHKTVSEEDGQYKINAVEGNAVLLFSLVGYQSQRVPVRDRHTVNVVMEQDVQDIDEVVVIGYGTKDRRSLTSSLSTIQAKNFENLKTSSMEQLIKGQAAGVQVLQPQGRPGSGINIRVRGIGSINAKNDPLYVIDGMPIEAPGYDQVTDVLSFLNPSDIESITILKDAASTAIYGSRGSNGVVLVTTKSGKNKEKLKLEVGAYYGFQTIPERGKFHMLNGEQYAQYQLERVKAWIEDAGGTFDPNNIPDTYAGYRKYVNYKGTGENWFDNITRTAPTEQYNVTITSGTPKSNMFLSFDYYSVDGVMRNTGYKRYSLRLNTESNPFPFLKIGLRVNPSYNLRQTFNSDLLNSLYLPNPTIAARNSDGSLNKTIGDAEIGNFLYNNWYLVTDNVTDYRNDFRLLTSANVDIQLAEGFYLKNVIGADMNFSRSRYFFPQSIGSPDMWTGNWMTEVDQSWSYGKSSRDEMRNFLIENYLSYTKKFGGKHEIDAMAGHSAQKQDYDADHLEAWNYPDDRIPYVYRQAMGTSGVADDGSDAFKYAIESYLARINYNFDNRYYFNASIRRDGSSRFSQSGRWGTFPSVSVGWDVANESFLKKIRDINVLKLRASYGYTGNANIGSSFAYYPALVNANYTFSNNLATGRYPAYVDKGLTWEKNKEYDFGLDLSILDRRLSFTVDYYNRRTYDLLLNRPTPVLLGAVSVLTNMGEVENKGWEFTVNSVNFNREDFQWNTGFNITFNKNKVLALNDFADPIEVGDEFNGSGYTAVGQPISMFRGYKILGVYKDQAEAEADHNHNPYAYAGSLKIQDTNNDGQITPDDRTIIGNPHPKFIFGMTNNVKYRNFDLSMLINGSWGAQVNVNQFQFIHNMDGVFNLETSVLDRWKSPEQPGKGIMPTTVDHDNQLQYVRLGNSTWIWDASYLSINNVTLGYTLPKFLLQKGKVFTNARFYISVQNAAMFCKSPLNNPEGNFAGTDLQMGNYIQIYPLARTVTFGTNISF
ncbi:SusC/RagA family TonB-linked outer membrane protein [Niabella ginsenosidivorans]|nr:TonB-dependent receptor [Niabella ginsenosidivorans]